MRIERCYSESHVLTSDVASIQGKVSTGDHVAIVKDKCRDPTLELFPTPEFTHPFQHATPGGA